jgi:hypothetical protein
MEAAVYPGWDQYYGHVRYLIQGVEDDNIPLESSQLTTPPPISKARLAETLIEAAERVPHAVRSPFDIPPQEELLKALTNPEGRNYDWRPWSAHWEGYSKDWTGSPEVPMSWDWLMPVPGQEGEFGVPVGGKTRVNIQEVISRKSPSDNAVEARLYNISDDARGFVRGWAPGGWGAEWTKAVWIAFPFAHGPCKCIIWLSTVGAWLYYLSERPKFMLSISPVAHGKFNATGPARP